MERHSHFRQESFRILPTQTLSCRVPHSPQKLATRFARLGVGPRKTKLIVLRPVVVLFLPIQQIRQPHHDT